MGIGARALSPSLPISAASATLIPIPDLAAIGGLAGGNLHLLAFLPDALLLVEKVRVIHLDEVERHELDLDRSHLCGRRSHLLLVARLLLLRRRRRGSGDVTSVRGGEGVDDRGRQDGSAENPYRVHHIVAVGRRRFGRPRRNIALWNI